MYSYPMENGNICFTLESSIFYQFYAIVVVDSVHRVGLWDITLSSGFKVLYLFYWLLSLGLKWIFDCISATI